METLLEIEPRPAGRSRDQIAPRHGPRTEGPQRPPQARKAWLALAALCLSALLVGIDNTIVNVALPTIGRELDASTSDLQWVVDAYSLVFASLLLVAGHLGDRFGRRRALQLGLLLFGGTSLIAGTATSIDGLIAGRGAMGAAAALIFPATLALISSTFPDRRKRAAAIGIWSGVTGLSVALGPLAGGLLVEHISWNAVFWVNVPLALVAIIAGRLLIGDSRDPHPGRFDGIGALLSVTAAGLLVWTVIEAPDTGWGSMQTIIGFAGSVLLLLGFVVWERRRTEPLFDVRLFANPRFSVASGAVAIAFFGLFGFIFLITQFLQLVLGYGVLEAGAATLPFAIVTAALSPVAIVLTKIYGNRAVVATGLMLMSTGFALAAGSTADSEYWGRIVASMVLMAAGLAFTSGPATEAIMATLPPHRAGAGSAVNDTTRELGGTLGVAVIGSVMSSVYGQRIADALAALPMPLPNQAVNTARSSLTGAVAVVQTLPPEQAGSLFTIVTDAFVHGLQAGSLVAAGAAAGAFVMVLIAMPGPPPGQHLWRSGRHNGTAGSDRSWLLQAAELQARRAAPDVATESTSVEPAENTKSTAAQ